MQQPTGIRQRVTWNLMDSEPWAEWEVCWILGYVTHGYRPLEPVAPYQGAGLGSRDSAPLA